MDRRTFIAAAIIVTARVRVDGSTSPLSPSPSPSAPVAEVNAAKETDPDGAICHFCGRPNDFADDCGWFYIIDPQEPEVRINRMLSNATYPACEDCYWKHSWKHVKLYGVGER